METLVNVIDLMLQTAMIATGQCDELERIGAVSILAFSSFSLSPRCDGQLN